MNPVDHPHGGGEGRTSGGRHPVTPWGKPTKGKKTRSNKSTDRFIVTSRHKSKKKADAMARSIWKGPFIDGYMLKKAEAARAAKRAEVIKTWSRRSTVLPQFVGLTFGVYNGHKHVPVNVTEDMIGHKLGEFSPTRTFHGHSADKKAKRSLMAKPKTERALKETEAKAVCRMIRVSPQKLNLLAQLIRGKKVETALADLEFSRKRIALDVKKTLESAIANAENNHDLDVDDLVVAEAHVGKALVMKRFSPRARGRAGRIEKPFANLTIIVREVEAPSRRQGGLRRRRWDRRSIRSDFGSASTAPGTRAGSPSGTSTPSFCMRTSRSARP